MFRGDGLAADAYKTSKCTNPNALVNSETVSKLMGEWPPTSYILQTEGSTADLLVSHSSKSKFLSHV